MAHHFAGLSLGEADVLRRGMSGKSRSKDEFQRVRDRFFANCQELGRDAKVTGEVWHQIESFAGYSFAKGHSASFAVESYQSLYLKAYYPLEFPLDSPFYLLKDQSAVGIRALDIKHYLGKQVEVIAYLVSVKYTRTVKGDIMNFGTFLDREGHWIDTVHFPPVVKKYPFKGRSIYRLWGKVTEEFGFYSIEASSCERMEYWNAEDD